MDPVLVARNQFVKWCDRSVGTLLRCRAAEEKDEGRCCQHEGRGFDLRTGVVGTLRAIDAVLETRPPPRRDTNFRPPGQKWPNAFLLNLRRPNVTSESACSATDPDFQLDHLRWEVRREKAREPIWKRLPNYGPDVTTTRHL
jgi:hypothetical protein